MAYRSGTYPQLLTCEPWFTLWEECVADYTTTWTFDADEEGWTLTDMQWTGSDGSDMAAASDPGCIETVTPGDEAGSSAKVRTMTLTGLTWEDLGVTPGENVVQAVANFRIKLTSVFGPFVEVACEVTVHLTSDDSLVCTAYSDVTQRTGMLTGTWQTSSGSPGAVDGSAEASDTPIYLKIKLSSASNAISYGWEFRIDTVEFITTGETSTPPTAGNTLKIPLTERDFTMPILAQAGVGLSGVAAYDYVCQVQGSTVTAATWKIRCACDLDPGVSAVLNVYTGWYGEDGTATQSVSGALTDGTYTELSFAMDAGQLADPRFHDYVTPFSLRLEVTAGTGGATAYIVSVHLEIEADPGTLYFPSIPSYGNLAPATFTASGTWVTDSGPPMQNEPVTLIMWCHHQTFPPFTALVRTVHVLTDGSGNWTYTGIEWCFALTAVAGWWYMDDMVSNMANRLRPAASGGFSPATLSDCATPAWETPTGYSSRMARASLASVTRNVALAWHHAAVFYPVNVLSGAVSVGSESNDYQPKLKFFGTCSNGGAFDMDGITLDVVGRYATESVTLDSAGETYLTQVDPQTIQEFTNVVGLPACGSLRTFPSYSAPSGTNRGDLYPRYPSPAVDAPFGLTHLAWYVPPACGVQTWVEPLLFCASCSGTITGLKCAVDIDDDNGTIVVAWVGASNKLYSMVNPRPIDCVDKQDGKVGWTEKCEIESANADDIGLCFLPGKRLYLTYDLSGAKKYRTHNKLGRGTASDWSASATPSPAVSRISQNGRANPQAFRFRALGGTPNAYSGAGDIEFSLCKENTGAEWTTAVTAVTGGRGLYCGGCFMESRYGLLYRKDSDGKAYWKTTDNPDSWGGGTGTDVSATITWYPVSLEMTLSGTLVALLWDAGSTNTFRAARSRDGGVTWEQDSASIDAIPPLTVPAQLCLYDEYIFAVWVANDSPCLAYSVDGGVTWVS